MAAPRKRDYKAEYAARKLRAIAAGFTSPRTQRTARERERGTTAFSRAEERARAELRAREEGFLSVADRRKWRAYSKEHPRASRAAWEKRRILEYFGITEKRFNEIRRENRQYSDHYGALHFTAIYEYDEDIDADVNNWSEQRVGYIISFHAAVVDPKTNYDSLPREWRRGYRKLGIKGHAERKTDDHGKLITNTSQFFYLVKYARIMSIDEFEARYGRSAIIKAYKEKLPAA